MKICTEFRLVLSHSRLVKLTYSLALAALMGSSPYASKGRAFSLDIFRVANGRNKKAVPHHTERRFSAQAFTAGSGRKGFSTAATLAGVWVSDLKTAPGQTVAEINHCATNVLSAERIHHNG